MSTSPLIKDGALSLTTNGDLATDLDIVTQMVVALTAYHCIYDSTINSEVIPYLDNQSVSFTNRPALTNIVVSAYQSLISQNIISNLEVGVKPTTISTVNIKISAVDSSGNQVSLNWINP